MLSLNRIIELTLFDFFQSLLRLRSAFFFVPYFFFWFLIFDHVSVETVEWLQGVQGLFFASWLLENQELALQLFVDRSVTLSLFLLISIFTMPLFVMMAANNQFSSDASSGAFRFILTRATRTELFIARFLSALLLVTLCILVTSTWAFVTAWLNQDDTTLRLLSFTVETILILFFYASAFVAFMSLVSSIVNSAIASLFLAGMLYLSLAILSLWLRHDISSATFLLPSSIKPWMIDIHPRNILIACAALSAYAICYFICGWQVFNRRSL